MPRNDGLRQDHGGPKTALPLDASGGAPRTESTFRPLRGPHPTEFCTWWRVGDEKVVLGWDSSGRGSEGKLTFSSMGRCLPRPDLWPCHCRRLRPSGWIAAATWRPCCKTRLERLATNSCLLHATCRDDKAEDWKRIFEFGKRC